MQQKRFFTFGACLKKVSLGILLNYPGWQSPILSWEDHNHHAREGKVGKVTSTCLSLANASHMATFHFKRVWGSIVWPCAQKENRSVLQNIAKFLHWLLKRLWYGHFHWPEIGYVKTWNFWVVFFPEMEFNVKDSEAERTEGKLW